MHTMSLHTLPMKSDKINIGISGSKGFLASELIHYLSENKIAVKSYARPNFDLLKKETIVLDENLDVFIHVAWLTETGSSEFNLNAVKQLKTECESKNIKFIFISSFSAHDKALSEYGQTKLQAELLLNSNKDCIIKPGLIVGKGGLFNKMFQTTSNAFIQQIPGNGKMPLQIIAVENICQAIYGLCLNFKSGIFYLANPQVYTLLEIQKEICTHLNKRFLAIHIPIALVRLVIAMADILKIKLSFSKENLLGLLALRSFDTNGSNEKLNIVPLSFKQALQKYLGK